MSLRPGKLAPSDARSYTPGDETRWGEAEESDTLTRDMDEASERGDDRALSSDATRSRASAVRLYAYRRQSSSSCDKSLPTVRQLPSVEASQAEWKLLTSLVELETLLDIAHELLEPLKREVKTSEGVFSRACRGRDGAGLEEAGVGVLCRSRVSGVLTSGRVD